jgi:hypothetical protein
MVRVLVAVGEYLKANADLLDEFTIDHFALPPFSQNGGVQRAVQAFGSDERLQRVLANLNRAVFAAEGATGAPSHHPKP